MHLRPSRSRARVLWALRVKSARRPQRGLRIGAMGAHCSQHCGDAVCCPAPTEDDDGGGAVGSLTHVNSLGVFPEGGDSEPPIGKVFDETVEHLRPLDRDLLVFCATSNLVAVRWLLWLGASQDARDSNGSTCLHVACRSGALPVIGELLRHAQLVNTADVAGWTPLHVAAHMGRREAVQRLLEARADPLRLSAQGQSPAMLCMEPACLDQLRSGDPAADLRGQPREPGAGPERLADDTAGIPDACEPEMVFVASPPAAKLDARDKKRMLELGLRLFQLQPSRGLAFVVAVGLYDSYPAAMKAIIRASSQRPQAIGDFLGEAFSVCPLVRFSVFDALPLGNTGVVSALHGPSSRSRCRWTCGRSIASSRAWRRSGGGSTRRWPRLWRWTALASSALTRSAARGSSLGWTCGAS
ncbi:unnamed protein product [Prorocentrum cordatum]|uniref:Uncharacterized protein n=1 Tax=Prorocentrum cordatum TaxID=2364126 RepID=A0ABN9Q7J9_9DINO|nr:unnamed protein product [Polarella glacialis]